MSSTKFSGVDAAEGGVRKAFLSYALASGTFHNTMATVPW
jgi:hypothetical protein